MARRTRRTTAHRKSKKGKRPDTPGGPIGALSILEDVGGWGPLGIIVQISYASVEQGHPGTIMTPLIGGDLNNMDGWAVYEGGINILTGCVITSESGALLLLISPVPTGIVKVVVPPFVPQLNAVNGGACAGGTLLHDYAP